MRKALENSESYEWVYEYVDQHGDIIDPMYTDSAADAFSYVASTGEGLSWQIALVKSIGNDSDGLKERDYAYIKEGKLPTMFPNENWKVPQRFHDELKLSGAKWR